MRRKILMLMALGWLMFFPSVVLAANSNSPLLDRTCWKRSACHEQRAKYLGIDKYDKTKLDEGFISGISAGKCVGNTTGKEEDELGKCLPAGKTKTSISFGGRSEFANVGDFILVMYKYLLAVASILAVIVIIVAGVQWTVSGGNSEMISSAKKRIGGALIGLFIGYMSYFILNTINPALVSFRLPQVFLIRPIAMPDLAICFGEKFAMKKLAVIDRSDATNQDLLSGKPFTPPPSDKFSIEVFPACNVAYAVDGVADEFCFGSFPENWNTTREFVCALSRNGNIDSKQLITVDHELDISGIGSNIKSKILDLIGTDGRAQVGMVDDVALKFACSDKKVIQVIKMSEEDKSTGGGFELGETKWWAVPSTLLTGVTPAGPCVSSGATAVGSCYQHVGSFKMSEEKIRVLSRKCGTNKEQGEVYMFLKILVKEDALGALGASLFSGGLGLEGAIKDLVFGSEDDKWVTLGCVDAGNEFKCEKIIKLKDDQSPEIGDMIPLLPILEHKALFKQIKTIFSTQSI